MKPSILLTQAQIYALTDWDAKFLGYLAEAALGRNVDDAVRLPDDVSFSDIETLRDLLAIKPQLIPCPGEGCGQILYPAEDLIIGHYEFWDGGFYDYRATCDFCSYEGPGAPAGAMAIDAFIAQALAAAQ